MPQTRGGSSQRCSRGLSTSRSSRGSPKSSRGSTVSAPTRMHQTCGSTRSTSRSHSPWRRHHVRSADCVDEVEARVRRLEMDMTELEAGLESLEKLKAFVGQLLMEGRVSRNEVRRALGMKKIGE